MLLSQSPHSQDANAVSVPGPHVVMAEVPGEDNVEAKVPCTNTVVALGPW